MTSLPSYLDLQILSQGIKSIENWLSLETTLLFDKNFLLIPSNALAI